MKNLRIIKKYFQVTKANKKITFILVLASLLANGPYMFTSLLFSLTINYLTKQNFLRPADSSEVAALWQSNPT